MSFDSMNGVTEPQNGDGITFWKIVYRGLFAVIPGLYFYWQFIIPPVPVPVTVSPVDEPKPVIYFVVDRQSQLKGEKITLTWDVKGADKVVISGIGEVPLTSSREEVVSETRTYELTATNRFKSDVRQVHVLADEWPKPTLSIMAEPNPVTKGESTTVRWQSESAKRVFIDLFGSVRPSGSKTLTVGHSLVLQGKAEGPGGVETFDLPVTVQQIVNFDIPKNQDIWIQLLQPLGSAVSQSENSFEAALQRDLSINRKKVASEGAKVWGRVVRVSAPGRSRGRASIELSLERLTLIDGSIIAINTDTVQRDKSNFGKDMLRIVIGAGTGAVTGAFLDGRTGATKGGAAGAGAGVTINLVDQGEHVLLPAGLRLKFKVKTTTPAEIMESF